MESMMNGRSLTLVRLTVTSASHLPRRVGIGDRDVHPERARRLEEPEGAEGHRRQIVRSPLAKERIGRPPEEETGEIEEEVGVLADLGPESPTDVVDDGRILAKPAMRGFRGVAHGVFGGRTAPDGARGKVRWVITQRYPYWDRRET
jgi:hypothetical protein